MTDINNPQGPTPNQIASGLTNNKQTPTPVQPQEETKQEPTQGGDFTTKIVKK